MKHVPVLPFLVLLVASASASAHDLSGESDHPHYDRTVRPPEEIVIGKTAAPPQAAAFEKFSPRVKLRWDSSFLYVESNGLPEHGMMTGITAWQQQVPLPQPYFGDNAWRIPLKPVPAAKPQTIKDHFLRGAIALAVNGIPIFNPQNNRGEISQEIGELDEWGGHCGRADDYHYHAAPLHLQKLLGKGLPLAFALDGYPIYGLTEPDGSPPTDLDSFNGHSNAARGYHYHASTKYPYVNGGFHGEVTEAEGQVDPQPRAQGVREALKALRGAHITGFQSKQDKLFRLEYEIGNDKHQVNYQIGDDGKVKFDFVDAEGKVTSEVDSPRQRGPEGKPGRADRQPKRENSQSTTPAISAPKQSGNMSLTSAAVVSGGALPVEFTGDGAGITPPLEWTGAPPETRAYAIIMDHLDPQGVTKWYWTLYDIPATVTRLPKGVKDIGKVGTGFKGKVGYEPPHSQGPGEKKYLLTVYALSAPLQITQQPGEVNRDVLIAAMKDKVLASSSLNVVYTSTSAGSDGPQRRARGGDHARPEPPAGGQSPPRRNDRPPGPGGADNSALVKPTMADTIKVNIYADNWFIMYINGKLVAVDPIDFLSHNVVTVDILPEYPMTIAVMAKDNADPKTGMEYGNHVGDGGFIFKFADGTVSNATWKAKNFFKGPLNGDTKNSKVEHLPIPANWFATDFDDSSWANATEYTEERVNPKEPFYQADFKGAKFIWTDNLDLDNTIIFRTKIEKPGWKPRWNTQPDLAIPTTTVE